ncbi:PAS domain S-box protein [Oxalobacteraceae bacterium A2-2]
MHAPRAKDDAARLARLASLQLLDTPPEPVFDRVIRLASRILDVPISAFSLVDHDRQWFKSQVGLTVSETPRDIAFCAHAIMQGDPLVVPDAAVDTRFQANPLVTGAPKVRFYAGVPIQSQDGHAIGTLCAIDTRPRQLPGDKLAALQDLAAILTDEVHARERLARARALVVSADRDLAESQERFRHIFELANVGIAMVAADGSWLGVNPALCRILGYGAEELHGKRFIDITHPDDRDADLVAMRALSSGELARYLATKRYLHRDGHLVWADINVTLKNDAQGRLEYYIVVIQDITAQKAAEQQLATLHAELEDRIAARTRQLSAANQQLLQAEQAVRQREAELSNVIEYGNDAYISLTRDGRVRAWNRQAEHIFGWSAAEALGLPLEQLLIPPELCASHHAGMARYLDTGQARVLGQRLELPALRKDGSRLTVEVRITELKAGDTVIFSAFLHDITERKRVETQREHETRHDALTGLPNRRAFGEALAATRREARRHGQGVALLFVDLDGFKAVNDSLGHDAGDELLRAVAARMRQAVRQTDQLFRLAGDEFTVLLQCQPCTLELAHRIAAKLIAAISAPAALAAGPARVGASVGVALDAGRDGVSDAELIREADHWMYAAKRAGKGVACPPLAAPEEAALPADAHGVL